jgi:hypothetical protein
MSEYQDQDIKGKTGDQKILAEAKKRFELCQEAERELRGIMLDDLKFRAGEQWDEDIKNRRKAQRKPCLTINVLPASEKQILNDLRQNRPAIKVSPVDDKADPETAEVLQGIIRHIEYDSSADAAYDTAAASAVRTGRGWLRVITEYEEAGSERQVIKIKRILNPFQVYIDPTCQEADYSDARYGFLFEWLTKEEFEREYPDSKLVDDGLAEWKTIGDSEAPWMTNEGIRICEYFYFDYEDKKKRGKSYRQPVIKWCKFTCEEILEKTTWPGKWIPLVPVLGDELDVDGKRILEGMVRHTKDPIRMQNVMASEEIRLSRWHLKRRLSPQPAKLSNSRNGRPRIPRIMRYCATTRPNISGTLLPPPARNVAEPAIQAITEARMHFVDDLKAVTGIYDAQLGARSNEQSGKAIGARKQQGEISNFHFADNVTRALKFLGLQLIDLIQKVMTGPQVARIIGEDDTQKIVHVNQQPPQGGKQQRAFQLGVGRYDVTVSSGPSYQTKRQEAVESIIELTRAYPQMAQVAGDLLVGMMDWPNHEKVAERLRKLLPPQVLDDDGSDPKQQVAKLQAQMNAMTQQHDQMTQVIQQQTDIIKGKQVEAQSRENIAHMQELSKLSIVKMQEATKLSVAQISASKDANQLFAEKEMQQYQLLHDVASQGMDQAHAAASDARQQSHDSVMQSGQQAHEQTMAEQQAQQAAMQQQTQIAADQQSQAQAQ